MVALGLASYRWQSLRYSRRERNLQRRVDESHSELRRSEARYRKIFERNMAGVVRATVAGEILDCNDAFARILGYSSREECQRSHRLRFGGDVEHRTMLEELSQKGSYESTALTRDGSSLTLLWNANIVMDETAEGFVIEGTVIDISERQRVEERMRRELKLESLEVLAGGIAHDFNNLLVGILGNAELARMEMAMDSPIREHLDEIEQAAHRAASLSKKMLAYSGKGRFVTTNLDLSIVVEESLSLIPIPSHIRLERHLKSNLSAIKADASQLHQMLSNLVANAIEAVGETSLSDKTGLISLTTGERDCDREYLAETFLDEDLEEGRYVFLEIRDAGHGIDPEIQTKVFDPFFTTRFPGRGLGLPVVLGIVRGHHGALKLSSEPGSGTVVQVLFPASTEAVAVPTVEVVADRAWQGHGKVLVVDDEAVVRNIASQMLEMLGFEVMVASDGDEGIEVFRRHGDEIVLVLLDLTMPRMSGEETFSEMRRLRSDVRVILISGYEEERATERFEALAGFIQKPYQLGMLREKIRRVLGD